MVVTAEAAPDAETLQSRAAALQQKFGFRFALPALLAHRTERPSLPGDLLTDDFAPVNLYDTIGRQRRKR